MVSQVKSVLICRPGSDSCRTVGVSGPGGPDPAIQKSFLNVRLL